MSISNGFSFSNFFKNLKFAKKIQMSFIILAVITTAIVLNDFVRMNSMASIKDAIFAEYVQPEQDISKVYTMYQKIQGIMLKFSMPGFQASFESDMKLFNSYKGELETTLTKLDSTMKLVGDETLAKSLTEVNAIWKNYKEVVTEAILSASSMQMYDMASELATSEGQKVGKQLEEKFDTIVTHLKEKGDALNQEMSDDVSSAQTWIIIGSIFALAIFLISILYLAPAITKPVKYVQNLVNEFSLGNYDTDIQVTSQDEFGELAEKMIQLRNAQVEKISAAERIAAGDLLRVQPASDMDMLAHSFNKEVDTIEELLKEANMLIQANQRGDLTVRGNVNRFSGDWRKIVEGINQILDSVVAPLNEAGEVLQRMASGDFTQNMSGQYQGDYQMIKDNVNKVIESMSLLIGRLAENASDLATSASEISSSTEEMAAGANEQGTQTAEVASAIEEMTKTIMENTHNANTAASIAQEAGEKAKEGGKVVEETISGINRISDVVIKSAETIQALGKNSDQIGEIIQVIDDIADQTNLLALNAAIEAARAGEQGRGFAVVADEVRKLAERTTKATKEIAEMIKKIQKDTSGAVTAINQGTKEVERGKELANRAGQALKDIISQTNEVADTISQLAVASEQQSSTSEQISINVEAINNVTQQSAQGTHQVSRAAENLYKLTESLNELIRQFKLNNYNQNNRLGGGNQYWLEN